MITSDVSSTTLNGNGVTTAFPFTFEVFSTDELEAWVLASDGTSTEVTDWTAVLTTGGGTLTYPAVGLVKLPTGDKITILRAMEFTQEVDLVNGNSFRAEVIEGALDNLTMQTLQLKEAVARAVRVPAGSSTLPDDLLAELADDVAAANASAVAAVAAKDDAVIAQGLAEDARDDAVIAKNQAIAAVGGVKISANDMTAGDLETKLLAGSNVSMTTNNEGGAETRTINVTVPDVPAKLTVAANLVYHNIFGGV